MQDATKTKNRTMRLMLHIRLRERWAVNVGYSSSKMIARMKSSSTEAGPATVGDSVTLQGTFGSAINTFIR